MKIFHAISSLIFLPLCLAVSALIFLPFPPNFPQEGLDHSWIFALNEAVVHKLSFGSDVVFTYGPYASLYTKLYHPDNFTTVIWGTSFLCLIFGCSLFINFNHCGWITKILLLIYCSYFIFERDAVFLFYPLMIFTSLYKLIIKDLMSSYSIYMYILLSSLGLLPLIKGTLIIMSGITLCLLAAICMYNRNRLIVLHIIIVSVCSVCLFWLLSGQQLPGIISYFYSMIPIVTGYSMAMSKNGPFLHIFVYLSICFSSLYCLNKINTRDKSFVLLLYSAIIFISFKEGFVRHDGHAITAFNLIILICFSIFAYRHPASGVIKETISLYTLILLSFSCLIMGIFTHTKNLSHLTPHPLERWKVLGSGIHTVFTGNSKIWNQSRQSALQRINNAHPIPALQGSTDIYLYNQSLLLASNNQWNPRPVFQSYNAYTQELLSLNKNHLLSENCPDNILFSLKTIDNRYPSLDDGVSWPAILDNFTLVNLHNDLAILKRKNLIPIENKMRYNRIINCLLYENVDISRSNSPLFVKIDIDSTVFGKIASFIFKSPPILMEVTCRDGATYQYRLIQDMAKSGFLISPLVTNTKGFALLIEKKYNYLANNMVTNLTIKGNSLFYKRSYTLSIEEDASHHVW